MAPSPVILSSPIILFLGAGASAPLEKALMDGFVKKLRADIKDNDQRKMLNLLTEFCGADLEAIMSELDTICGMRYAAEVTGTRYIRKEGPGPSVSDAEDFSLQRTTAISLSRNVKHEIIREYRQVDPAKTVKLYGPLFDALFSQLDPSKQCLTVFTTNYDPAIEVFCEQFHKAYHLCDGFTFSPADRHLYWNRAAFDNFELVSGKRNIVLFKIHGSVDWLHVKATDRIRRGQAMYDALDSDAYANVLIYPATRKIATSEPYYSGYEYYQRCCESTKVCLSIGYSFRDYDALTRLRGASSVNEQLLLTLLAPDADAILQNVPIPKGQKRPMPYYFGNTPSEYLGQIEKILDFQGSPPTLK